jgi:hypothetical protein
MRVSFDLDDTLIFKTVEGPTDESLPPLQRSYQEERLRAGTREVMLALAERGHELWIYTNSFRGKTELLNWFAECWLPVTNIVNQQMHDMKRSELGPDTLSPAKCPPWFGIDVHIDDSLEIEADARLYGFKVIRIAPDDADWVASVLAAVDAL